MNRVYEKGQILFAVIAIPLVAISVFAWLSSFSIKDMPLILGLTFALIGFWAVFRILTDFAPYSLNKMHWYFVLVFMVIAPVLHYLSGWAPWGFPLSDDVMLRANFAVISWCVFYELGRVVSGWHFRQTPSRQHHTMLDIPNTTTFRFILLLLSVVAFAALVAFVGFSSLAVRGEANLNGEGRPLITVFNILLRAVPAISAVIVLLQMKHGGQPKRMSEWFVLVALLAMTLVANNPISMSRFWTAAVYLGILLAALPESWLKNGRFDLVIIVGLLVVFPLMGSFKTMTLEAFLASGNLLASLDLASSFKSVDFDAYSMLCRVITYCDSEGFYWGRQLLSVIFFFVPRSVLAIKGTPTGEMVAISQGQQFTNLSSPLMSEGYVDFGLLGLVVYGLASGWLLRVLDNRYWRVIDSSQSAVPFFLPVYLTLFGFAIFILRGPLQSTFLRLMGFLLFVLFLYVVVRFAKSLSASSGESSSAPMLASGGKSKTVTKDA